MVETKKVFTLVENGSVRFSKVQSEVTPQLSARGTSFEVLVSSRVLKAGPGGRVPSGRKGSVRAKFLRSQQ